MACQIGACEINNNRPKSRKTTPKAKKAAPPEYSSSEWSDMDDSCSGCSACWGSSSTSSCSCSECNMETDSSEDTCYLSECRPKVKKTAMKPVKSKKVLQCKDGVCQWVPKKKIKKAAKPKKSAATNRKPKKPKPAKNCYDCC